MAGPGRPTKEEAERKELANYAQRLQELHAHHTFHPAQQKVIRAIFNEGKTHLFCRKGRKGGGTEASLYPAVRMAGLFDNQIIYLVYPTHKLGVDIIWKSGRLKNFIPKEWGVRFKESDTSAIFPNGSFIQVLGADNWKAMVGMEFDLCVMDELKDHDPRAYENMYPNRMSRNGIWMILGAPPYNNSNFYYKKEQEALGNEKLWSFHKWSIWDNTYLPYDKNMYTSREEYLADLKAEYERKGDWDLWRVEWEAEYIFGGRLNVFPNFLEEKHIVPHDELMARIDKDKHQLIWWQGFDPGYATCFASLFVAYNPYSSEVYFLDEIYETRRDKNNVHTMWPRICEKADGLYKGAEWMRVYDSAAANFPPEVRAQFGTNLSFIPIHKEKDDQDKYCRLLNSAFALDRAFISDRCGKLRWEIENYILDKNDEYPKRDDHAIDAARYIFKMLHWNPVETQRPVPQYQQAAHMHGVREEIKGKVMDLLDLVENFNVFDL